LEVIYMKKIPVGILGATGMVGQRFVQLLAEHPWFAITAVTGSSRTIGRPYGEGVNWVLDGEPPDAVAALTVQATDPGLAIAGTPPIVFSALPSAEARTWEPKFAAAGYAVVSNASAFRMAPHVPLLIPEINPEHTGLIPMQQQNNGRSGFIVASPNCSTTSAVLPLKVFQDAFGVEAAIITTLQAVSGAGYPGLAALDIMGNAVPHIGGEDEKLETEPRKLLGTMREDGLAPADLRLSAQANRVAVRDGHLASVSVKLREKATAAAAVAALQQWRPPAICAALPSAPDAPLIYRPEPDRPQPLLDRDNAAGLAWTVGKVRACDVLDVRYVAITHNTLRGAASGSILNAELLVEQGYVER
jgi:aspartate-semialdehyde dehydrogenase